MLCTPSDASLFHVNVSTPTDEVWSPRPFQTIVQITSGDGGEKHAQTAGSVLGSPARSCTTARMRLRKDDVESFDDIDLRRLEFSAVLALSGSLV